MFFKAVLFYNLLIYFLLKAQNPIIIAHRGASAYGPENKL